MKRLFWFLIAVLVLLCTASAAAQKPLDRNKAAKACARAMAPAGWATVNFKQLSDDELARISSSAESCILKVSGVSLTTVRNAYRLRSAAINESIERLNAAVLKTGNAGLAVIQEAQRQKKPCGETPDRK